MALTEFNGIPAILRSYLERCGALTADWGAVRTASLRGGPAKEVVIVAAGPKAGAASPLGMLSVLGSGDLGWEVLYEAGVAADVVVLAAEDINADGHPDVAWSDTTCGAKACFSTVHIVSWVDGSFQNWIEGSTTMASAVVQLGDVVPEGSGQELVMSGGVVGTMLAGPQRVVTNTWASPAGAPYELIRQESAASDCLYHRVQDGDIAMATGAQDGYAAAIAAYRAVVDDPRLVACWIRENEPDELRAYALYRLAVAQAYAGQVDAAGQAVADLAQRYPTDSYANLAELWWIAYRTTRDASAACAVARTVAERHPDTWERFAAYGFATIGAFAIVTLVRDATGEATHLSSWAGLGKKSPLVASAFALFLLAFAGIPLTSGFTGKFAVFTAGIAGGATPVVIVGVVASAVAAFFYIRVIVLMFFNEPAAEGGQLRVVSIECGISESGCFCHGWAASSCNSGIGSKAGTIAGFSQRMKSPPFMSRVAPTKNPPWSDASSAVSYTHLTLPTSDLV